MSWIVAVSGGPDSMALLDLLYKKEYELIVAHVNYLSRPTSGRDEQIVRKYCQKRNIPVHVKNFNLDKIGNFQHDARNFRYDFFKDLVYQYNAHGVALGHHLNDDLETYIFQKQRDMYSDNIGLVEKNYVKNILVWRPLLEYTKEEILKYCKENRIPYGIDESNLVDSYTRNKIRHKIDTLSQREFNELVTGMTVKRENWSKLRNSILDIVNSWENLVPLRTYAKIDKAKRFLCLREWLRKMEIDVYDMSEKHLLEIDSNLMGKSANYEVGEYTLCSSYDNIILFKKVDYEYILKTIEYLQNDYFKITKTGLTRQGVFVTEDDFPLTIRPAKSGDKIKMKFGTKKVNRYFIDEKVSHDKRAQLPIIVNAKDEVIFVAGLGCDVHHYSNNPSFFVVEL